MFAALIAYVTCEMSLFCQAPRLMPTPLKNLSLVHVSVITRHGHRTPNYQFVPLEERGTWECRSSSANNTKRIFNYLKKDAQKGSIEYLPNCMPADLTLLGEEMHKDLGATYRKYYVDELHFLPEKFSPKLFHFESSPTRRTFLSAESFINGLYPPTGKHEIITIASGSSKTSSINGWSSNCKLYKAQYKNYQAGPDYQQMLEEGWPMMERIAKEFQMQKTVTNMRAICSWATAFNCTTSGNLPDYLDDKFMSFCYREQWMSKFGIYNFTTNSSVAGSPIMRRLLKDLDTALANGQKFSLFSGHDSTIAAVLTMLGKYLKYVPTYASHLNFELFRSNDTNELFVRFTVNGETFKVQPFDQVLVPYKEFRAYFNQFLNYCPETSD
ncbi:Histidine acid phosphatase family protein [Trichomonas vaginalis G3]|uniref:Histidine acid phosphatase family protein n=1 Tax=Trichomonas vaginalis (strain ATCC PRA-98 / G3) TaxID=412133 RepID=A2ET86_TRIV3|nr:histidine acid phosphatase [Trichomonas vaginalis G3]EAY04139.1 Histidine acid phosphatase family protein [Trichomonas vaginalis G3]KAI5549892.1 acid phosphatase protein [Trichomonas vaginalis G3]|eukprot:XP_001316362.1 histidine acid phosphatase [Trichomonas vaginalis G3]